MITSMFFHNEGFEPLKPISPLASPDSDIYLGEMGRKQ